MIAQLGKYEIRRELARGAMGVVYEAYDTLIKRRVALKTIRPDQLDGEKTADMLARFRREAQAAGRLNHPNIVAIYDFDEDAGTSFIAMEFVEGRDLKECFAANERFRMQDIERIMTAILDALDYSHRQGVVHRDIKPANIFLLENGGVKVADFGIAHIDSSSLTQVGTVVGTPNYMSPEQIMGLPVDGRTDIFAAGVILYQFLTGERPFAGSTTTTMQKVLKEDPLPPSTLNVQLPAAIDAVVRKALAKRADDRYQTAREFGQALVKAIGGMRAAADPDATMPNLAAVAAPAVATPATAGRPTSGTAEPSASPNPPPPPAPTRTNQRAAFTIVAAIAIVGVVALAATWWLFPRSPSQAPTQAKAEMQKTGRPTTTSANAAAPAAIAQSAPAQPPTAAPAAGPAIDAAPPGKLLITAVGFADPTNARYANDRALLASDVRADSRNQLVEKALLLMLDRKSFATNYELLQSRVVSQSGSFIANVVTESAPAMGQDGLMSVTTQAMVDVDAIRRAVDRMSREERVNLIRAGGDPRIAVSIAVREEGAPAQAARPSPIAENVVKERIQAFGFRTWSETSSAPGGADADFVVTGEASVRKLSTRLAASGLTITKYALASWTVKCTDRATSEEIYFNTKLPKASGSYATEEEALRAIGTSVADEFSRDFFLSHVPIRGRRVSLAIAGLPDGAQALVARELAGLPGVLDAKHDPSGGRFVVEISPGSGSEAIDRDIVRPMNAKLGDACFATGASDGAHVSIAFDARCSNGFAARLEANPPAGLYDAPLERRKSIISNPETLRKLMV
ncbi:MAG TPA: serine/threonine-protein kinase [Casimicrobiaceae bacterium]|nr:serine/threonine-protein kinase [Casimicrobiaceae bacterium]